MIAILEYAFSLISSSHLTRFSKMTCLSHRIQGRLGLILCNNYARYSSEWFLTLPSNNRECLLELTVSQICSFTCWSFIGTVRDPNSTPIVRSWVALNLLSVNCSSRHDFPTPICNVFLIQGLTWISHYDEFEHTGISLGRHSVFNTIEL